VPLGEYVKSRFYYGIKTGLNEAFVVAREIRGRLIAEHRSLAELLKPFLRGRDVKRWRVDFAEQYLITIESSENKDHPWSNEATKRVEAVFRKTYPAIHSHFELYRKKLIQRYDQGRFCWELRSCDYWPEFQYPKVILGRFMNKPIYAYDDSGFLHNDALYLIAGATTFLSAVLSRR
jgi:adenine-specific DNA-methyltransferase